jgi:hypothetical protein
VFQGARLENYYDDKPGQWFGIVFLPAAYLHLSDALLVTAGRPSRGRRRFAVRGMYFVSAIFKIESTCCACMLF